MRQETPSAARLSTAQQNKETQLRYDELEQYGWRLCLRIDSVPKQNNEKAENVFKFVKGLTEDVPDLEIPEVAQHIELVLIIPIKKCRKCASLSLFDLQRSVILQHFTEL